MSKRIISVFAMIFALISFVAIHPVSAAPIIDPNATGSLSITKYAGDPLTQYGDPSNPLADTNRDPVPGIEFTIQRINSFDLTTNSGWEALEATEIADFYASGSRAQELGAGISAITNADGVARFNNLAIGAYYVTETSSTQARRNTTVSRPFVVTIPATNAEGTGWNYDVAVNAKDQILKVTEKTGTQCVAADKPVTFGVSATIPEPDPVTGIGRYEIYSPLPSVLTDPRDSQVYITVNPNSEDRVELSEGDYRITFEDGVVRLVLQNSGLEKLTQYRTGNPDAQLTWLYTTTATEATSIVKTSYLLVDGYPAFDPTQTYGVAGNEVNIGACAPNETPSESPVPVPVPTPEYNPTLFPGTRTSTTLPVLDQQPQQSTTRSIISDLASTGANVLWVAALGFAAIAFGVWLMRRNRERSE